MNTHGVFRLCTLAEKNKKKKSELVCFTKETFQIFVPNKGYWFLNVLKFSKKLSESGLLLFPPTGKFCVVSLKRTCIC